MKKQASHWFRVAFLGLALAVSLVGALPAWAQESGRVQILSGEIDPGGQAFYILPNLKQGQRIYAYAQPTSGNLDPIVAFLDSDMDLAEFIEVYQAEIEEAAAASEDVSAAINAVRDQYTLAWDDDSGEGYDASLEFSVPADGSYRLIVAGSLSSLGRQTFGGYRLLLGLDAPQVLSGQAEPSGEPLAQLDPQALPPSARVQEATGSITGESALASYRLVDLNPGDTLYVYVEATSGDLAPVLLLRDYGDKAVAAANLGGESKNATLQYAFDERSKDFVLQVRGGGIGSTPTSGSYRLLVGLNDPEVLSGKAVPSELPVFRQPIEVKTGVKLQQIVQVNQQDEFFTVVASMQMEWTDPELAFSPADCQCRYKVYTEKEFDRFLADVEGKWPDFTLYNQQGNRWVQNRVVVLEPDGHSLYFERFSTNLQLDFDFRKFPFDNQQFLIRIDMIYPEELYYFTDLEGYSEISPEHGEDEFIITGYDTQISSVQSSTRSITSRFTFSYQSPRHLNYYFFQIFVPVTLIILISWFTFFLKDYTKRIEVSAGNILLFIAFSFSLSDNYPRLGYMTFLDAIMAGVFIINALVLIYNVYLRRLEMRGNEARAESIDQVMDWVYPIIYLTAFGVIYFIFFVIPPPA